MQRYLPRSIVLCLMVILAACQSNPPTAVLPTATPAPTQPTPTTTPTPLPPPTVTPFPTKDTSSGAVASQPESEGENVATPESPDILPTPTTATTQAAPAPATAETQVTPTQPTQTDSSGDFPPGVALDSRIFFTDFYQGWPTIDDATAKISIKGGKYAFEVGPFDARFIATTTVNSSDIYTRVEVTPDKCPEGAGYGLLFRQANNQNYYTLNIFCSNAFSVVARVDGSTVGGIFADGPLPAGLNASSPGPHKLGVMSRGNTHTIYFDEQVLGEFENTVHEKGDVALQAFSQSDGILQVAFDNWEVWAIR